MNHEEALNRSGFPLQIALENLIGRNSKPNGWNVVYSEHQWKNKETDESGFIDLVVEFAGKVIVLVIECKRVYDSSWLFLNSEGAINNRRHTKAWITHWADGDFKAFNWQELAIDPSSPECEYSIVHGQDPKSKPMLERTASTLISSTEAFAKEESPLFGRAMETRIYFNVIVTTAKLQVASFKPESISLTDGTVSGASFKEVPYLRFRKQLQPHIEPINPSSFSYHAAAKAKENSVFIVNSEHVMEFLDSFDVGNLSGVI